MSRNKYLREQSASAVQPGKARRGTLLCAGAGASIIVLTLLSYLATAQKPPAIPTESLPPGPLQAKATTACLECHEARIILQQRLSKAAWTREVDKMIKWGAVVDPADRDALIDYLSTNFPPDQPPYQPPRSSSEKSSGKSH